MTDMGELKAWLSRKIDKTEKKFNIAFDLQQDLTRWYIKLKTLKKVREAVGD